MADYILTPAAHAQIREALQAAIKTVPAIFKGTHRMLTEALDGIEAAPTSDSGEQVNLTGGTK